jgi:hypothetical protein
LLRGLDPKSGKSRLFGTLKYFQANFVDLMTMAIQVCLKGWQHLPEFGGGGVGVDQQAPL